MIERVSKPFKRIVEEAPCVWVLLPLMAGIAIAENDTVPRGAVFYFLLAGIALLIAGAVLAMGQRRKKNVWKNRLFICSTSGVFLTAGAVSALLQQGAHDMEWAQGERVWRGTVTEPVRETKKTLRLMLALDGGEQHRKVVLSVMKQALDVRPQVGEAYEFEAEMQKPYNYGDSGFDYARWLQRQGVSGMAFTYNKVRKLPSADAEALRGELPLAERCRVMALGWRARLLHRFDPLGLDGVEASVLAAITLGEKTGLNQQIRRRFADSGVSHVLALSGLHLSILVSFLMMLLWPLRVRQWSKWVMTGLAIALIWCFVLLTGCSVSVVRSAIMLSLMLLLGMRGEGYASLNNVALAALTIILLDPDSLMDLGFQLSFLSVASLVYFMPYHLEFVQRWQSLAVRRLMDFLYVETVAQLATMPLVMCVFGKLPLMFLLANAAVLPCVYVLLASAFAYLLCAGVPWLSAAVGWLVKTSLAVMMGVTGWVSALPFSNIPIYISPTVCALLYPAMFSASLLLIFRRRIYLHLTLLAVGLLFSALLWGL